MWRQIRGVPVGSVLTVQPSLERVDVLCDIKDPATVIPRNSLIEANQSGLIAEPLIDITPQLPIPEYQASTLRLAERAHCAKRHQSSSGCCRCCLARAST
jgi:ABC-type transporter Mla subunit MlaD